MKKKISRAEEIVGVRYSEMNEQQKRIYHNKLRKESHRRMPEKVKEQNRKYREQQKQYIADLEAKLTLHEQSNKVLNDQLNQATEHTGELNDKLAESENKVKGFVELFDKKQHENYEQFCEIQQLKQELVEKDEQIKTRIATYEKQHIEQINEIYELEQQLAESKEQIWALENQKLHAHNCLNKLKQQLAEKEKEILNLKNVVDGIDTLKQYDKDAKQIILINPDNVYADGHRLVVKSADQDKISFAVEQLEKVKDEFFDVGNGWWLCFKDGTQYMTHDELEGCVRDVIDNQIKQLKEGK